MGAASRTKGAAFEREIAGVLFDELGIRFERDLDQYRKADRGDLIPDDPAFPFLIECKRRAGSGDCERVWRDQAARAAQSVRKMPAVVFRYDRKPARVSVPLRAFCEGWPMDQWAEVSLAGFCFIAREVMAERAGAWAPNDYRDLRDRIVGKEAEA